MTNDDSVSRRRMLAIGGTIGAVVTAGCMKAKAAASTKYTAGYESFREGKQAKTSNDRKTAIQSFTDAKSKFKEAEEAAGDGSVRDHCKHAKKVAGLWVKVAKGMEKPEKDKKTSGGNDGGGQTWEASSDANTIKSLSAWRSLQQMDGIAKPKTVRNAPWGLL